MTTLLAEMIQPASISGNTALLNARMFESISNKTYTQCDAVLKSAVEMFQAGSTVEQVAQMLTENL